MIKNELGINSKKKQLTIMKMLQETEKVIIDVMRRPTTKKRAKEMEEKKRVTLENN
jgi:hypothetical protein